MSFLLWSCLLWLIAILWGTILWLLLWPMMRRLFPNPAPSAAKQDEDSTST
jgi:hypothetical protein